MALDEAVASCVGQGKSPPTLRLYGWERPSVSLGRFQKLIDLDEDFCSSGKIPVVRRPTGGRAVLHDRELTYSFSIRTDHPPFSGGLLQSYRAIGAAFTVALRRMGIDVEPRTRREKGAVLAGSPLCFLSSSYGEMLVGRRKLVGSAQKRWGDFLLQQGSIPYEIRTDMLRTVFGLGLSQALAGCMVGVSEILPDFDEVHLKRSVAKAFEDEFRVRLVQDGPSQEEVLLASRLEKEKYLRPEWNLLLKTGSPLGLSRNNK